MSTPGPDPIAGLAPPPLLNASDVQNVAGLFTDVDDTLTREGKLSAQTYQALWDLKDAGIPVVPVTGRSYGWAHMMLSQWPVPAVITESGGAYLSRQPSTLHGKPGALRIEYFDAPESVARQRDSLMQLCSGILKAHPGLRFASDNALRQVDVAIDYCEEVPPVPMNEVQAVISQIRAAGFQARNSTVHINAWHGQFDKGPMALRYLEQCAGLNAIQAQASWMFVGDAPNDASMFELFPRSVAVANIAGFLPAMPHNRPARITKASFGEGFIELARLLLANR